MPAGSDGTAPPLLAYGVAIALALVVGILLFPSVSSLASKTTQSPQNSIAVIQIRGPIDVDRAEDVREQLLSAASNDSVKAVVLRVNSPGGTVSATESIYFAVNRTAQEKPVVASVSGLAASGGYFSILPADRIYTTPGAQLGSVGVIGIRPEEEGAAPRVVSGPDKVRGGTAETFRAQVESLRREFVGTVYLHRQDKLEISPDNLSYAQIYIGARAVENGIADRIGSRRDAIIYAAQVADVNQYVIADAETIGTADSLLVDTSRTNNSTQQMFGFAGLERRRILALYGQFDRPALQEVKTNATG